MAILGHSPSCVAAHPPDMAVALIALGARVQVAGPDGGRWVEMPRLLRPE
jgi:xanthine dehydrogenase YagS FAD-binding subunit